MEQLEPSDLCDICCSPRSRHIASDLQCPETTYFRAMPNTRPSRWNGATGKRPHCDTCGRDVHEILCPICAKWWADNPPPSPSRWNEAIEAAAKYLSDQDGYGEWQEAATAILALKEQSDAGDHRP